MNKTYILDRYAALETHQNKTIKISKIIPIV